MRIDALQHIDEIIERIDLVESTGHQQALQDAELLGAEFGSAKESVFTAHRNHA